MKPFWKNTRKKKSKKHSEPSQQKPRIQTRPKPMEEPWKPPMAVPPKAVQAKETPIVPMLESARPVKKEYVPHRMTMRKSEYIKVENALTEPMTSDDSMENYWFTPMYFSDVWHTRRMIHKFTELFKEVKHE